MPDPKKPGLFDEDDDRTQAVPLGADDDEHTELAKPGDLPFKQQGLLDEDDETTRVAPRKPAKK